MKHTSIFINAIVIALLATGTAYAQTPELKPAPAAITIDGNVQEWGEMNFVNDKAKIAYTITNDKDNLYLVIKTNDIVKQRNIIGAGITFSINTKGKKSTTHMLTFPFNGQDNANEFIALDASQLQAKAGLTKYQKIRPQGFADITDEQLSVSNPYGIKIALDYDNAGYMTYEEAIPLTLFHAGNADNEWAFNIKINGLANKVKPVSITVYATRRDIANDNSMRGIAGGTAPGSAPYGNFIELTKPADFWVKFKLAKTL
jgi:hypothetical protein